MTVILCSPAAGSIIKAAILAEIHHDLPCFHGEEADLGLFSYTGSLDADKAVMASLLKELRTECGLDANWLLAKPGQALARVITANLRYTAPDGAALIFAAVEQALRYGHDYCLCGISDVAKIFIGRARSVSREVHKMLGFIRFQPGPDNLLIAKPQLFHNTADLILKQFATRYPQTKLVFLLPDKALVLEDGHIQTVPAENYAAYTEADEFTLAWETYYQSQYIATRKNMTLAQRVIPKKYWNWLEEGKFLYAEAKNK